MSLYCLLHQLCSGTIYKVNSIATFSCQFIWVWYAVLFCVALSVVSMTCTTWCLENVRCIARKSASGSDENGEEQSSEKCLAKSDKGPLETKGITLTFKDINYIVDASTTKDKLHLLNGINGYFAAGTMTALMGSR